jgi:predicted nucleic acid-binding protein
MTASTRESEFAIDTMGLVLRLEGRKLGLRAREILDAAESGGRAVHVPGMVLAEVLYLYERGRISLSLEQVADHFERFPAYTEFPLSFSVVRTAAEVSDIPELHDRLIAASARLLGVPLITNDPRIQASRFVETVWE